MGDLLQQKLTELESDSFQLKLRNYYLERRLNASLSERESNDERVAELLEEEEEEPRGAPLRRWREENEALRTEVCELREKLESGEGRRREVDELRRRLAGEEDETTRLTSKLDALRTQFQAESPEETRRLRSDLAALRAQLEEEREAARPASDDDDQEVVATLRREVADLRDEVAAAKREAEEAKREAEAEVAEARRIAEAQVSSAKKAAEDVVVFEAEQIAELAKENEALKADLDELKLVGERTDELLRDSATQLLRTPTVEALQRDIRKAQDETHDRFAECLAIGADLAAQSRRGGLGGGVSTSNYHATTRDDRTSSKTSKTTAAKNDLLAIKLQHLLAKSRDLIADAKATETIHQPATSKGKGTLLDPRLTDCLDLALRLTSSSSNNNNSNNSTTPS